MLANRSQARKGTDNALPNNVSLLFALYCDLLTDLIRSSNENNLFRCRIPNRSGVRVAAMDKREVLLSECFTWLFLYFVSENFVCVPSAEFT